MPSKSGIVTGLILMTAIPPLAAQQGRFEGPNSGLLFHLPSHSVRAILGVPGAAWLSSPFVRGLDFASVAPDGDRALIHSDSGWRLLDQLSETEPRFRPVEGVFDGVGRVAWNRKGSFAVLWSPTANGVQRIRISPNGVSVEAPESIAPLAGTITVLTVDSSGEYVVIGVQHPESGGLYVMERGGSPRLVAPMATPADAVFTGSGRRLFAADRSTRSLVELTDVLSPAAIFVDRENTGNMDPIALAVFEDSLFVANASSHSLLVFSLAERRVTREITLEFEPAGLIPFSRQPLYLLRSPEGPGEPAWLLDARQEPAIWFVPAAEDQKEQ